MEEEKIAISLDISLRKKLKKLIKEIEEEKDFKAFLNFIEKLQNYTIREIKQMPKDNNGFNYKELKNHQFTNDFPDKIIVSLRVNRKFRVYGYFQNNIFRIIELDKNHNKT